MNTSDITVWLAFGAGFLSFISPCCLPLYPSFLSYITGVSVKDLTEEKGILQRRALYHTFFFILGFSIIFLALGFSLSVIGELFSDYQNLIRQLGGILVILMGLVMLNIFQPRFIMKEFRLNLKRKPNGYLGSTVVGIVYAAGWTPCIGPILSAVFALSAINPNQAIWYIGAYSFGFSIPFFIMAFFVGKIKWVLKYSTLLMRVGGAVMVLTGILLYTDKMTQITIWFIKLYGGFTGF